MGCQARSLGEGKREEISEWARKEGKSVLGRGKRGVRARRQEGPYLRQVSRAV